MQRFTFAPIVAAMLALSACGPGYTYTPAVNASAQVNGQAAAFYQIPQEAPEGDVRLASFGVVTLVPRSDPDREIRAMQIRMVVSNSSASNWTVDTREQVGVLADSSQASPLYTIVDGGRSGAIVGIPAGQKRNIDLFYALPSDTLADEQLGRFELIWRVNTSKREVSQRTPFDRRELVYSDDSNFGGSSQYSERMIGR